MNYIIKNHQFIKEEKATISINERGFLFGDGAFESLKIIDGNIYDFNAHFKRIKNSLDKLKILAQIDDLQELSNKLIKKNQIANGILRISITRGIGSVGYAPSKDCKPLIIIKCEEERKLPNKITLGISKIKRNCEFLKYKTNNCLTNILNKIFAHEEKLFDLIMKDENNYICETSSANIFWVKNNKIYTPSKACNILDGCVRQRLIKLSPQKIIEKKARISEVKNADEIFLTNSSFLVLGVDEIKFDGKTKKLKKDLAKKFLKLIKDDARKGN